MRSPAYGPHILFSCCSLAMRWLLSVIAFACACRAAPIAASQRYPAGTSFREQYRTIDGTRLRLIDSGNGTPVVFIHGIGASLYSWRRQLEPVVSAGYRVIVFDNRGFGFSDKPAHGYQTPNTRTSSSHCSTH